MTAWESWYIVIPMTTENILRKINALLAKAEATEFQEEASSFIAKATELMAQHRVDMAMLADAQPKADEVIESSMNLTNYMAQQDGYVNLIARALGIKLIGIPGRGRNYILIGYESDIDSFSTLVTSLDLQMLSLLKKVSGVDGGDTRVRRRSFATGFMSTVASRVTSTYSSATEEAVKATETPESTALVLASREQNVQSFVDRKFPRLRTTYRRYGSSSYGATAAGREAGKKADIGLTGVGNRKKALNA